jgi:hypothetical protein
MGGRTEGQKEGAAGKGHEEERRKEKDREGRRRPKEKIRGMAEDRVEGKRAGRADERKEG